MLERWAGERADFRNAFFTTDGVPYTADDILGRTDQERRKLELFNSKMAAQRANIRLERIKRGDATPGMHELFTGPYQGDAADSKPKPEVSPRPLHPMFTEPYQGKE